MHEVEAFVPVPLTDLLHVRTQLLLTKLTPGPVSVQDIPHNIALSSISNSAKQSLYHALKNVYALRLDTEDDSEHSEADMRLHDLLMQLETGLGSSLRQQQQANPPTPSQLYTANGFVCAGT